MMRVGRERGLALIFIAGMAVTCAMAESPSSAVGYWEGSVDSGVSPMALFISLAQGGDGSWGGKIDIPSQGVRNLDLDLLTVEGTSLTFGVTGIYGSPVFTGELSEDGQAISGTLSQAGRSFPFSLRRSAGPPQSDSHIYDEYERAGEPGSGLQGMWLGLLDARPARLRMILKVSASPDGALTATLDMPDQNSGALYVDTISLEGESVSFSMAHLMASYHGEMSEDGSAVTGSWEQGERDFPLNFKRQISSER